MIKNKCVYSGEEITNKKDIIYSPYPPSFFLAKNPHSFFSSMIESIKTTFRFKIYSYHINSYQFLFGKYFETLEKLGLKPVTIIHKQLSQNKKFMRFVSNPKRSLIIFGFIDLVIIALALFIVRISDFSNLSLQLNSNSIIMMFVLVLFLLVICWLTIYNAVIYFRVVRPSNKMLK